MTLTATDLEERRRLRFPRQLSDGKSVLLRDADDFNAALGGYVHDPADPI